MYAALHDPIPENAGFLRDEAVLFAPPDTDVFDPARRGDRYVWRGSDEGAYGPDTSYFRQTRFALQCGDPPEFPPADAAPGPLACAPAPNRAGDGPGKQYDVRRYIDFFTLPRLVGGVKPNPLDVVLVGIDGPDRPFDVIHAACGEGQPQRPCAPRDPGCQVQLKHTCENAAKGFYADPAVRLNAVIRAARENRVVSICDDSYDAAFALFAQSVASSLGGGCLPDRLPREPTDASKPLIECHIEDLTTWPDGTERAVELLRCRGDSGFPCWRVEPKPACQNISPDGLGVTIDRNGQDAPPYTYARVNCLAECGDG